MPCLTRENGSSNSSVVAGVFDCVMRKEKTDRVRFRPGNLFHNFFSKLLENGNFVDCHHFVTGQESFADRLGRTRVLRPLCGTICGANPWADRERFSLICQEWFEQFPEDPNGVPSLDTFGRVFRCRHTADLQAYQSK
jgi:hypothetical protein